jgi:EmrB/QacA subfamily drug resistance transporter
MNVDAPPADPAATAPPTTAEDDHRWLALVVLCAGMLMIILDETVVNVALESMQRDLGMSSSSLAWIVNAYLVAFGGLLLLAGRIGDLFGRRRVFLVGMTVFTLASVVCGVSTGPVMLIVARFVQGAGGAMTSSVVLGMIVTTFRDSDERAKAIGAFSFAAAAGGAIGLALGGGIVEALSWHWVFFVNVPVGVAAIVVARRVLPATPGVGAGAGADVPGALLATAAVMVGVLAIVGATDHGWLSMRTIGLLSAALLLLAGFVGRQRTARTPIVPLRIFRSKAVSGANAVYALLVGGMFGFQFMTALYLQRVLDYSPGRVGLGIAPVAVAIGVVSLFVSPRLGRRFGPQRAMVPGLTVIAIGIAWLTRLPADSSYLVDLLPAFLLMGIGFGLAQPAITAMAMSDATDEDSGLASGLFNTTQQVSGALGLAVAASVSAARSDARLAAGTPAAEALTSGYALAFTVSTGLTLAALALAVVLRASRTRDAR